MDQIHTQTQWYSIASTEFGFLSPQQIRKMSVKEITNPNVYDKSDKNKMPTTGGLYDPALGVSPNDKYTVCVTCGKVGLQCSGHSAHIELLLPAYNPITIDTLLKLLRMKCFNCHRIRIKSKIKEDYKIIFTLVKKGEIYLANQYMSIDMITEFRKMKKLQEKQNKIKQPKQNKQAKKEKDTQIIKKKAQQDRQAEKKVKLEIQTQMQRLNALERRKAEITAIANQRGQNSITETSVMSFGMILKGFYSLVQAKCPFCQTLSKTVKKEGANKFFIFNREKDLKLLQKADKASRKKSKDAVSSKFGQSTVHPNETEDSRPKYNKKKYLNPKQVSQQIKKLWSNESQILSIIYGNLSAQNGPSMFFMSAIFVPPSRFRPESVMNQQKYLHDHTMVLSKILTTNIDIKGMIINEYMFQVVEKEGQKDKKAKYNELKQIDNISFKKTEWFSRTLKKLKTKNEFINKWLQLQDYVNCFLDATRSSKASDRDFKGIRQILEKKEGLFRMKMMGKRVNFAARSVISPDPSLDTNQVGLPEFMAKKLSFPEHVNEYSLKRLQECIINGKKFPGASQIIENGVSTKIDQMNIEERTSLARNLLMNNQNKVVLRHVMTGDNVLFNRQPTLHKPGLMAHKVKVLPRESTLRMNYANCKSYNADFDGDQMNLHAIQNYLCKAQAELCISDNIYNNPTNGKPIRQLIQDSIIAAVYLTMKDTFLKKKDYAELLYQSTFSLLHDHPKNARLFLLQPAIIKPQELWTGKQLFSNVIKVIVELSDIKFKHNKGLNCRSATKIGKAYMQGFQQESQVLMIDNMLLKGIIDKNSVGSNAQYGLVHSFNELYGEKMTGKLLTCLTKLFLNYMQLHGFTCGLDDLILKKKQNRVRRGALDEAMKQTMEQICQNFSLEAPKPIDYVGRSLFKCDQEGRPEMENEKEIHLKKDEAIVRYIQKKVTSDPSFSEELDGQYKHFISDKTSKIVNDALLGFSKKFPANNFSMMTVTGAKGSNVNHSQVAVMLGQQQLQGRRVPIMISGKTLPSFIAYDPNPRASGFISDRFLTGLRYQQFYFHCMAGRQGLIDTAVKTSRSGYLQRCLMKHLESLKVEYDYTVRDADGGIIQFLYGEDSLDPTKQKFFSKIDFIRRNLDPLKVKYNHKEFGKQLKTDEIFKFKNNKKNHFKSILNEFRPGPNIGTISDKCFDWMKKENCTKEFNEIYSLKYMHSLINPGESVGCTAAQSIGQPSTQMTLNTFHLAGHGAGNLTLGIPRLRQLLMTSSDKIKTPIMELKFETKVTKQQANSYVKILQKVKLCSLIRNIEVQEWKQLFSKGKLLAAGDRKRFYKININYEQEQLIEREFSLSYQDVQNKIKHGLVLALLNHISRVKKKSELKTQIKKIGQKAAKEHQLAQLEDEKSEKDQKEERQLREDVQQAEQEQEDKDIQTLIQDAKEKDRLDRERQAKQNIKRYESVYFQSLNFTKGSSQIVVKVPLNMKKFLMTKVIEKLIKTTIIRQVDGIKAAYVLENKQKQPYILTEGVNFKVVKELQFIKKESISSNDISAINRNLGIEAARNAMIKEIVTLFGAYGVTVDYRHLYLIGDYVTFLGKVKAMNRLWMGNSASPFQRISFETSNKFITGAALHCEVDTCKSPSSSIILGQPPRLGTGICQILMETSF